MYAHHIRFNLLPTECSAPGVPLESGVIQGLQLSGAQSRSFSSQCHWNHCQVLQVSLMQLNVSLESVPTAAAGSCGALGGRCYQGGGKAAQPAAPDALSAQPQPGWCPSLPAVLVILVIWQQSTLLPQTAPAHILSQAVAWAFSPQESKAVGVPPSMPCCSPRRVCGRQDGLQQRSLAWKYGSKIIACPGSHSNCVHVCTS